MMNEEKNKRFYSCLPDWVSVGVTLTGLIILIVKIEPVRGVQFGVKK